MLGSADWTALHTPVYHDHEVAKYCEWSSHMIPNHEPFDNVQKETPVNQLWNRSHVLLTIQTLQLISTFECRQPRIWNKSHIRSTLWCL